MRFKDEAHQFNFMGISIALAVGVVFYFSSLGHGEIEVVKHSNDVKSTSPFLSCPDGVPEQNAGGIIDLSNSGSLSGPLNSENLAKKLSSKNTSLYAPKSALDCGSTDIGNPAKLSALTAPRQQILYAARRLSEAEQKKQLAQRLFEYVQKNQELAIEKVSSIAQSKENLENERNLIQKNWRRFRQELAIAQPLDASPQAIGNRHNWVNPSPSALFSTSGNAIRKPNSLREKERADGEVEFLNRLPLASAGVSADILKGKESLLGSVTATAVTKVRDDARKNAIAILDEAPLLQFISVSKIDGNPTDQEISKAYDASRDTLVHLRDRTKKLYANGDTPEKQIQFLNEMMKQPKIVDSFLHENLNQCSLAKSIYEANRKNTENLALTEDAFAFGACLTGVLCGPVSLGLSAARMLGKMDSSRESFENALMSRVGDSMPRETAPGFGDAERSRSEIYSAAMDILAGGGLGSGARTVKNAVSKGRQGLSELGLPSAKKLRANETQFKSVFDGLTMPAERESVQKTIETLREAGWSEAKIRNRLENAAKNCVIGGGSK
jgi:hypothetical protein